MAVIIFVLMLLVLIVGHEFGHLLVAKATGMKVPEFGIGFPPKLFGKKIGDTEYTVNAVPFGGFVKIFGEDDKDNPDPAAFSRRSRLAQAATLFAGPGANILLGLVLSTLAFMVGIPSVVDSPENAPYVQNPHVLITEVLPKSPAALAGLKASDEIISISYQSTEAKINKPEDVLKAISAAEGPVVLTIKRNAVLEHIELSPVAGIAPDDPQRKVIGIAPALVGTLSLPIHKAFIAGMNDTYQHTKEIFFGLVALIGRAFTFSADLSTVAGPVGIVSLVGDAAGFGLGSILAFAALISVNLGIVNLLPFPALDGGRLAFLLIETVFRRRIPAKVSDGLNIAGFAVLIILMLAITAHDIFRLLA